MQGEKKRNFSGLDMYHNLFCATSEHTCILLHCNYVTDMQTSKGGGGEGFERSAAQTAPDSKETIAMAHDKPGLAHIVP